MTVKKLIVVSLSVILIGNAGWAEDDLAAKFQSPPASARPGFYWDWMGGLISREGITKDLEAMAAQGIGRVLIMQMPDQCPYPNQWQYRDFPGRPRCLSDEWFALVNHAIGECDRLGLELAIYTCPGWGHVGGPWVTPDKVIKKVVSTEVEVKGPVKFDQQLPKPPPSIPKGGGNEIPAWNKAYSLTPKAVENFFRDEAVLAVPDLGSGVPVPRDRVIDLTDHMDARGKLTWDVPEGKWIIQRVCLVADNWYNHPAPPETFGCEADRMDPAAVRQVFDGMVGRILREARAKGYKSFTGFETDSYETGYQDFCVDFREQFKKRRGYDCMPWLPVWLKPGTVIESPDLTARFKDDMMRTISELWTERFQGTLRRLGEENGITWMTEPYWGIPLDWTTVGGTCTMPGSEFWVGKDGRSSPMLGNTPEIAVVHGRKIVWAESFTAESYNSAWRNDPWILKRSGDDAFSRGINMFYMHGFVHNPFPDDYQPGLTMGYWGTQFSRHQTWWPLARPWLTYLARCQSMLQAGEPVYDILNYNISFNSAPALAPSDSRSACITDEGLQQLVVRNGRLVLPDGAEFAALSIQQGERIRPEALRKIKALVADGAVLLGDPPPAQSPSLEGYPACDVEAAKLVGEIWGTKGHDQTNQVNSLAAHRVKTLALQPDFLYEADASSGARPTISSRHRIVNGKKLWFVCNQGDGSAKIQVSFRVEGMQPEWWDPQDGSRRELPEFRFENGRTILPLDLAPWQSGFVVFKSERQSSEGAKTHSGKNFPEPKPAMEVGGLWEVKFDSKWGGPEKPAVFESLMDWTNRPESGIKYYSGIASYRKVFDLSEVVGFELLAAGNKETTNQPRQWLNLGVVHNLARVKLNGRDLGVAWCAPWRVAIPAGLLKKTGNKLEIEVANTWVNRLIGDEQEPVDCELIDFNPEGDRKGSYDIKVPSRGLKELPDWLINRQPRPSKGRYTFSSWLFYNKEAPLLPSGLLGPVQIFISEK